MARDKVSAFSFHSKNSFFYLNIKNKAPASFRASKNESKRILRNGGFSRLLSFVSVRRFGDGRGRRVQLVFGCGSRMGTMGHFLLPEGQVSAQPFGRRKCPI